MRGPSLALPKFLRLGTRNDISSEGAQVVALAQRNTLGTQDVISSGQVEEQVGLSQLEKHDSGRDFEVVRPQFPVIAHVSSGVRISTNKGFTCKSGCPIW